MFQLLYDPVSEIKKAKKESYARILMYLIAASFFETTGLFFLIWRYFSDRLTTNLLVNGIIGTLFSLIELQLIVAFFFSMIMHVLDGKGGYYEGLASLVLSMVAPAMMTFFAGALVFLPYGAVFASLLFMYGYAVGASTLFRAGKEFFELDYAGVLAGVLILVFSLAAALCGLIMLYEFHFAAIIRSLF